MSEFEDTDYKLPFIVSNLLSNRIDFAGLGTNTNKIQYESVIDMNSGNGIYIPNTNMNTAMDQLGDYILQRILDEAKINIKYVLLGEEVEYDSFYTDAENDPEYERKWRYIHDHTYFENSLGKVSYDNQWIKNPVYVFDRVGEFEIQLMARDNPVGTDNRFDQYRYWSELPQDKLKIYVHRKPIAQFNASAVFNQQTNQYITSVSESSYDIDHISLVTKGIIETEWKWKNALSDTWIIGALPSTLPKDQNYLVSLRVKDMEEAWSEPSIQLVTTKNINLAPIAQFSLDPNPLPINKTLTITDKSYDPNGNTLSAREWIIEKDGSKISTTNSMPTTSNFVSWGVGTYKITLRVKDTPLSGESLWSEPYSQVLFVIPANQAPIARYSVTPNPVLIDAEVTFNDISYDPDNDPIVLKEWKVKKSTEPESAWRYMSTPPTNFETFGVGTVQVALRVKDQPTLPQLEALWSPWNIKNIIVLEGNKAPIADFALSPNPVPADEKLTYIDKSYDPEGKPLSEKEWTIRCLETNKSYKFTTLPPTIYEATGWGQDKDGVGTYEVTLRVKDTSNNGLSPAKWSEPCTKILIVEEALRIDTLVMTTHINAPYGTKLPVIYPVTTPPNIKAGYRMTFSLNTNGGDLVDIKIYSNGKRINVFTDTGKADTISKATVRKNGITTFSFWIDQDTALNTVLDMKIELSKKTDTGEKRIIDTALGESFAKVIGSSKEDSGINLTY